MSSRNLVICCAGDQSLHRNWSDESREFDLCVVYFGTTDGKWRDSADYYLAAKGPKWHLVPATSQAFSGETSRYDSIWMPDDDIDSYTRNVNGLFRCFDQHRLALAQPALSAHGYISHAITRERRRSLLRCTNFAELMVPMMRHDVFARLSDSFTLNKSGWGLDYLWASRIEKEGLGDIAGLDRFAVTHTRPVDPGGGVYAALGLDPQRDLEQVMDEFGLSPEQRVRRTVFSLAGREFSIRSANLRDHLPMRVRLAVRSLRQRR